MLLTVEIRYFSSIFCARFGMLPSNVVSALSIASLTVNTSLVPPDILVLALLIKIVEIYYLPNFSIHAKGYFKFHFSAKERYELIGGRHQTPNCQLSWNEDKMLMLTSHSSSGRTTTSQVQSVVLDLWP